MNVLTSSIAAAMLALANVASAEEPMMLNDAQMDSVSAGFADASIFASVSGSGFASVSGFLDVSDDVFFQFANASVSVSAFPFGAMTVNAGASASTSSSF